MQKLIIIDPGQWTWVNGLGPNYPYDGFGHNDGSILSIASSCSHPMPFSNAKANILAGQ